MGYLRPVGSEVRADMGYLLRSLARICFRTMIWMALFSVPAAAQLNQNCVVGVLHRTGQVNPDGPWVLPNIPANFGPVRARPTCVNNGVTTFGQSPLFTIPANGSVNVPLIVLGSTTPIPTAVNISTPMTLLSNAGATTQLTVSATYAGGQPKAIPPAPPGTPFNVTNPASPLWSPVAM